MKKRSIIAIAAATAICACSLAACEDPVPEDHVAPVLEGVDTVRIDLSTDTFNVYNDVVAVDKDDDNNEFDLTKNVKVVAPSDVTIDEDGVAKFKKAGDYSFLYYVTDAHGNSAAVNRRVEVRNIYNLYWGGATLPVMYCALDMVTNNYKSLIWVERADTLNMSELNDERFIWKVNGAGNNDIREAEAQVARIAYSDPYSYFRFFVVDARNEQEFFTFQANGITQDRYEVKMVSDGSLTYGTTFVTYRGDDALERWNNRKKVYYGAMDRATRGDFTVKENGLYSIKVPCSFGESDRLNGNYFDGETWEITSDLWHSALEQSSVIAAQRDNVELWCSYPETLKSTNQDIQKEFDKINMPKMAPDKMYAELTDEQRAEFLKIVNFDKADFDEKYFTGGNKYLIVTGTSNVRGNSLTNEEFFAIIERIIADNPGYTLLFKPHPNYIPSETYQPEIYEYFNTKNIKLLPGRLPMEVISWVYNDVPIGGFDSSLFMSVPQQNVRFFIAKSNNNLTTLSKQLYNDGVFGDPTFYWKAD